MGTGSPRLTRRLRRVTGTMRVMELPAIGAPLRLVERPIPEPGPGEVRVRVQACGVCGSDVFLQKGGFGAAVHLPAVPGHEAAGMVDALGDGVEGLAVGDLVAIYYITTPAGRSLGGPGSSQHQPEHHAHGRGRGRRLRRVRPAATGGAHRPAGARPARTSSLS